MKTQFLCSAKGVAVALACLSSQTSAQDNAAPPSDRPEPPQISQPPANPTTVGSPNCTININDHRAKYPVLYGFLQDTSFQGSEEVFATRREAIQYYFSQRRLEISDLHVAAKASDAPRTARRQARKDARAARQELREQRQSLRSEIKTLRDEYPRGECRKLAWAVLGQADLSDAAIDANATEASSDFEPVEE